MFAALFDLRLFPRRVSGCRGCCTNIAALVVPETVRLLIILFLSGVMKLQGRPPCGSRGAFCGEVAPVRWLAIPVRCHRVCTQASRFFVCPVKRLTSAETAVYIPRESTNMAIAGKPAAVSIIVTCAKGCNGSRVCFMSSRNVKDISSSPRVSDAAFPMVRRGSLFVRIVSKRKDTGMMVFFFHHRVCMFHIFCCQVILYGRDLTIAAYADKPTEAALTPQTVSPPRRLTSTLRVASVRAPLTAQMSCAPSSLVILSCMSPRATTFYAGTGRAIPLCRRPAASSKWVEAVNETNFCDFRVYLVFVLRYVSSQIRLPGAVVVIVGRVFACPGRSLVRHPKAALFFVLQGFHKRGIHDKSPHPGFFGEKPRKARAPLCTRRCMHPCVSASWTASSPASMLAARRGKIGDLYISRDRNSRRLRQGGGWDCQPL